MKGTIAICMGANIDMMAALVEDLSARIDTAQIDLSTGNQPAAIGGLTGVDEMLDQIKAHYIAARLAYLTAPRGK